MLIHDLLGIKGFNEIHDAPKSIPIVEVEIRKFLSLRINASADEIKKKYEQLHTTPPFDQVFEAYRLFVCVNSAMQKTTSLSQEQTQQVHYPSVEKRRVPNTAKECHYDFIAHACYTNDIESFKKLLSTSPRYTFNHYFRVDNKITTCLKEAIRHNNSEMIDEIIKRDATAITDIYRGKHYKVEMSILPELFFCNEETLRTVFKHFDLINKINPRASRQTVKINIVVEAIRYFLTLTDEEQKNKMPRLISILQLLQLNSINNLNEGVYRYFANFMLRHEQQFKQNIMLLFNQAVIEMIKKELKIPTFSTPENIYVAEPVAVPQIKFSRTFEATNQPLNFEIVVMDSDEDLSQQPSKKLKTSEQNNNNNNSQDSPAVVILSSPDASSVSSNSNLNSTNSTPNIIVINSESELDIPSSSLKQVTKINMWKTNFTVTELNQEEEDAALFYLQQIQENNPFI